MQSSLASFKRFNRRVVAFLLLARFRDTGGLFERTSPMDVDKYVLHTLSPHPRFQNLTGSFFLRWKVIGYLGPSPTCNAVKRWLCRCQCGTLRSIAASCLKAGNHSPDCGCETKKTISPGKDTGNPLYETWRGMIRRCCAPNAANYRLYGGRGISVCKRWLDSLDAFASDMGQKPTPKHSIDRYPDNNGSYEPGNCRWATATEQGENRRNSIVITWNDTTLLLSQWSERTGISVQVIGTRLRKGWPLDKVFANEFRPFVKHFKRNVVLSFHGQNRTITEWSEITGTKRQTLLWRFHRGWSAEQILDTPAEYGRHVVG